MLGELTKKAEKEPEDYAKFWENFGAVLKEGIYEDHENRDELLKLARFRSTAGDGLVSLDDYVGRMKPGQEAIYTITGDELEVAARSPQLEGFRAKGVEVLLLTDPVDEFWIPVGRQPTRRSRSARVDPRRRRPRRRSRAARTKTEDETKAEAAGRHGIDSLIAMLKLALGDEVKDVRVSERLTDSPVCLVADEGDIDMHLERLLRPASPGRERRQRILEINPKHPLIRALAERARTERRRRG